MIYARRPAQARIFDPGMHPGAPDVHIVSRVVYATTQPVPAQVERLDPALRWDTTDTTHDRTSTYNMYSHTKDLAYGQMN